MPQAAPRPFRLLDEAPRSGMVAPAAEGQSAAEEKSGALTTRKGLRLRLVTDLGNVRILTRDSDQVSYKVRIETDARELDAQNLLKLFVLVAVNGPAGVQLTGQVRRARRGGFFDDAYEKHAPRLRVSFEVSVPRNYNLDVLTRAGNIQTQDIAGVVSLVTSGGNITAGRIGVPESVEPRPAASSQTLVSRLETAGGHISVQDVQGDFRAITAGGHIAAGNVRGDAVLRSGGGHIRAETIEGAAQLETGGGNITVRRAGGSVTATTGGGQIEFDQAGGSIWARTKGGAIRILRVSGPTQLETGGGSIFLTNVEGSVRASTVAGTITASFTPEASTAPTGTLRPRRPFAASQLESGMGDIVVYVPREWPMTIEATIERGAEHRIEADPSLPLKVSYLNSGAGGRAVRGECTLNGGGEVLRLKTVAGNIRLKYSDSDSQALNRRQNELKRRMELLLQRQLEWQREHGQNVRAQSERAVQPQQSSEEREAEASPWEEWGRKLEEMWSGGVHVSADEQQRKLIQVVRPVYPDVARQAGLEGAVRLRVVVAKDGTIQDLKVLSGEPVLVKAATEAVRQWRYRPTLLNGKPASVVTTVTVEFRLQ